MKIALFTETYLPHINGVVTHVKSLKDGLEQLGHEVLVVTADASLPGPHLRTLLRLWGCHAALNHPSQDGQPVSAGCDPCPQ